MTSYGIARFNSRPQPPASPFVPTVTIAPLLLDAITNLGAVYSFRKLITAFAGNCVRIRRSSDNAEQDFGFVSNVVDAAGIATFVGGGSGFIVTWYDQSGNGIDITQATAGAQPQYIATGINSLPTARFDGSDDLLAKASVNISSLVNADEMTFLFAQTQNGTQATNGTFGWVSPSDTNVIGVYASFSDAIYFDFGNTSGGRNNAAQPSGWDDTAHITEGYRATGGTQEIMVDGASIVSSSRSGGPSGTSTWNVGANPNNGNTYLKGDLSELMILKNDTGSTNRSTIRKDGVGSGVAQGMGPYYGITVS